jgi:glyoxylase-like metal-dependent hydrolase (beta-lactamase superfamily II)
MDRDAILAAAAAAAVVAGITASGSSQPLTHTTDRQAVAQASSFVDEEVLDAPGRLRVIHTPGHTTGYVALSLEDREALIVGDMLATIDLVSDISGPHAPPRFMNDDHERGLASLQKIELIKARWVLPAHGLPWEGSPQQAVTLARQITARPS